MKKTTKTAAKRSVTKSRKPMKDLSAKDASSVKGGAMATGTLKYKGY